MKKNKWVVPMLIATLSFSLMACSKDKESEKVKETSTPTKIEGALKEEISVKFDRDNPEDKDAIDVLDFFFAAGEDMDFIQAHFLDAEQMKEDYYEGHVHYKEYEAKANEKINELEEALTRIEAIETSGVAIDIQKEWVTLHQEMVTILRDRIAVLNPDGSINETLDQQTTERMETFFENYDTLMERVDAIIGISSQERKE